MKQKNLPIAPRTLRMLLLTVVALWSLCTACSNEEVAPTSSEEPVPLHVEVLLNQGEWGSATRAASISEFAANDAIGITSSEYTNIKCTYDGSAWSTSNHLYFNRMYATFTAYYPYIVTAKYENVEAQDFLFAQTVASIYGQEEVAARAVFHFQHVMCQMAVTFSSDTNTTSQLTYQPFGTFDPTTGEAVATGDAATVTYTSGTALLLFPQSSVTLTYTTGGAAKSLTIAPTNGFTGGKSYRYTIQ